MISSNITKKFLANKEYDVMILDVNSLFLFSGKNSVNKMYTFINSVKKALNNENLLVINVIDNGLNKKMLRRHPQYKKNRKTSKYSKSTVVNRSHNKRSFKYKIDRIHKVDQTFKNHLTFYLEGESDFKIGFIIK